ncbi:MAG: efflux RND transporter permease subunit [Gammaproteobacteria bacterium]|nr:efflux RND transporter permease subunit [Gammaproteobacteria bacterium]MCP4090672.1 efflux RND transporter permease subunit [Gammaproteobacteria bacterium]MCP4276976.1 efflux RND transporter permease subunit [Gammaproteobacteria bacterium]MCP4832661.1 efflux RND transporter permease subunit [Gammaproteobacteria bacterium]MCP4930229.1 efflux RND transporter permease subunit [Gammaproteobacteria bacterium]
MDLIQAATNRSRTALIAFVVIIVAGIISYNSIPKESEPEIDVPFVYVEVTLEGVAPEDAERLLARPLEQELRTIEGLKEMVSSGGENRATVTLEFEPEADVDKALNDVREKVDLAKAKLPTTAEEPRVMQVKFSRFDPMLVMLLGGDAPERTLQAISLQLKDQIAGLTGVMEVNIVGAREELLEIIIDPLAIESYDLSPNDILAFVENNNRLVAAGSLQGEQGRFAIKVPGVIESPEDVLNLPIKVDQGRVVRFRDIATVRRTFKDSTGYARLNGKPAVAIEVVHQGKSNVLQTIANVKEIVEESSGYWPPGLKLTYSRDKSYYIKKNISTLMNNVATAVVLVFIVLIGILGIQNALLVGIAIPGSFCAAFFFLDITGMTINMVVLFAMIMAVGMLVDGAIVVTELADRKMAEGIHRRAAYTEAAQRMAWPIIASTATTLAAFVPLVFWPGFTGKFLQYMPLTLIYVLSASLLMALLFVPTMGSIIGKPGLFNKKIRDDLLAAEHGDMFSIGGYTGSYLRFLDKVLNHPWKTLGSITLILFSLFAAYIIFGKGIIMFPDVEPNNASVDIRARGDLSIQEKDKLVRQVEERIYGIDGIDYIYIKSGATNRGSAPDLIGSARLNFRNWRTRRPADEILAEINERTSDIAGIIIETRTQNMGTQEGKPINIELSSPDLNALKDAADKLRGALETIPGVINAEDTRPMPGIEWQLKVDRTEAARFGADVTLVGTIIQLVTNGIKVGEYRPDDSDEEIDIRVRFPADKRSLDRLGELRIPTARGSVPIDTFVTRTAADATRTIMRTDTRRTLLVQSDLKKGVFITPVLDELQARVPGLNLDPSVTFRIKGGGRDQQETIAFLQKAFAFALALMAMILVTQFNSLFQAFLILTAVVFSSGGVLLGLLVTNQSFSLINCGIGGIALAGIVVNNNIVLIDTYNKVRKTVSTSREAIMRTCAQRMRPVMLTTVTTVLGLIPMAAALNIDVLNRDIFFGGPSTQWWKQMASSICGGLIFATILTLLLTPSLLMIQANFSQKLQDRRQRKKQTSGSTAAA